MKTLSAGFAAAFAALMIMVWTVAAFAPAAHAQGGPVVLTVAGKIAKTNRGARDSFADPYFTGLDLEFDKAFAFDVAGLAALGMTKLATSYPDSDRKVEVEGPLLADVLKAVGASGETIVVVAIDGYAAEIPMSDIEDFPIVLALKSGGRWLGLGGRGPLWVVYPRDGFPALAGRDDSLWVWSAFFIQVD
jgi:hypothetical protein